MNENEEQQPEEETPQGPPTPQPVHGSVYAPRPTVETKKKGDGQPAAFVPAEAFGGRPAPRPAPASAAAEAPASAAIPQEVGDLAKRITGLERRLEGAPADFRKLLSTVSQTHQRVELLEKGGDPSQLERLQARVDELARLVHELGTSIGESMPPKPKGT